MRLVDDLLDVSRITRGKVELSREPLELAQIVTKAVEVAGPALEERRHHLTAGRARLRADRARRCRAPDRRSSSNLLNNAAKFTEPGGQIAVSASREGGDVLVRVRDSGIGIAADALPHIFDLFMQAPQSLARSQGGLGLGLAIVRSLVHLHGGTVKAHSAGLGKGSEFVVQLPLASALEKSQSPVSPGARAQRSSLRSLRVLVVDDNLDGARMLADALAMRGHRLQIANNGPAGLSAASAFKPDVALLDLGLPVMDGYEVAKRLRAAPGGEQLRLVAITGYGQAADRERTREAGFDGHLVKPVIVDDIDALLEQWF